MSVLLSFLLLRRQLAVVLCCALIASGTVMLGVLPVSADTVASGCANSAGTATITLNAPTADLPTRVTRDAAGSLVVDGTACGTGFPASIDLTVAVGAPAQRVVLDQNGSGGVFPCSTMITGTLRGSDVVEVDGAPAENLIAGSVGAGLGVDLNACSSVGAIVSAGAVRLVAGPGATSLSAAGNSPAFTGPLPVPVSLQVAGGSSQSLLPGGKTTAVDFSALTNPVTINRSGHYSGPTPDGAATSGGQTYTFASFGGSPATFIGSSSAPTTFLAGSFTDTFQGGGTGQDVLSFAGAPGNALRVCVAASTGCTAGEAILGSVPESFSQVAQIVGLPGGNTTFVAAGTGGHLFTATGTGNALDATPAGPGAILNAATGTLSGPGSGSPDTFTDISTFTGSQAGQTRFIAGPGSETFTSPGAAADSIDLSQVPTSPTTPMLLNVSGGSVATSGGAVANDSAAAGPLTYTFAGGGAGFTAFIGPLTGNTVFAIGSAGGYTFTGQGPDNSLDAGAAPAGITINTATGSVTGLPSGGDDTLQGLASFSSYSGSGSGRTTVIGGASRENITTPGNQNVIKAGAASETIMAPGMQNILDFSSLTNPVTVNASGQPASAAGSSTPNGEATSGGQSYDFSSAGSSPVTFVGSATAPTTFFAGTSPNTFQGGGTGQDELSFTNAAGASLRLCVAAAAGCSAGEARVGSIVEKFSGIARFDGLNGGNTTFVAGDTGGYTFTGAGSGNTLNLAGAPTASVNQTDGIVTGLGQSGQDTFSGIQNFVVNLYLTAPAPSDATVGSTYTAPVAATGSTNPVVVSIDGATTNDACTVDPAGTVKLQHVGQCVLDASQNGDTHFATAGPINEQFPVGQEATTTTVAVTSGTITATVTPQSPGTLTPSGTVSFTIDGTAVGTQTLDPNGIAVLPYTVAPGRSHQLTATYAGTSDIAPSVGSAQRTDPTITAQITSKYPPSRYGWYRSPVTVTFTCTAHGASLAQPCPSPVTLTQNRADQSVTASVTATDAGSSSVTVGGINIDQVAPVVRVAGISPDSYYADNPTPISCTGEDQLSGALGCTVTTNRTPYAGGWIITYTAQSLDRAGNVGVATGSYNLLTGGNRSGSAPTAAPATPVSGTATFTG